MFIEVLLGRDKIYKTCTWKYSWVVRHLIKYTKRLHRKSYSRPHDLVNCYGINVSQVTCRNHNPVLSSIMTHHRVFHKSNMMGATSGAGIANHSREPNVVQQVSCCSIFSFLYSSLSAITASDYPLVNHLIHGNTLWIRKYKLVLLGLQKVDQIYKRYTYKYCTAVDKSIK